MVPEQTSKQSAEQLVDVRVATEADQDTISRLFEQDREAGEVDPDDSGADVHNIGEHYLGTDDSGDAPSRFWVAEQQNAGVIGMVGVRGGRDHRAQMRRLLVLPEWRKQGVGSLLVQQALRFCSDRGYVKVALDTQVDQKAAIALFKRFGFQLNRTKMVDGKERMEFYMDLYRSPTDDETE